MGKKQREKTNVPPLVFNKIMVCLFQNFGCLLTIIAWKSMTSTVVYDWTCHNQNKEAIVKELT